MLPRARSHAFLATATALAAGALLAGCGQKGPLYIPHTPQAEQRATLPQSVFGTHKQATKNDDSASRSDDSNSASHGGKSTAGAASDPSSKPAQ